MYQSNLPWLGQRRGGKKDDGYHRARGSKADFQRLYREAFVRGYLQAYGNVGYRR